MPGRICLFGEHSDWAGGYRRQNPAIEKGYTLICGVNQGVYARISPHPTKLMLRSTAEDGYQRAIALPMGEEILLKVAQEGGFWSYIAGTALQILRRYPVGGLTIDNYKTDLPIQKGLSSSAAISVLTARAFNQTYQLGLNIRQEMELAYLGEITTPSRCGRMDQGCAFGGQPILMIFDGDSLEALPAAVGGQFYLVVADLNAGKNTTRILTDLQKHYPMPKDALGEGVHRLFGTFNKRVTMAAADALRQGDAAVLGALMTEAQAKFDQLAMPASPAELTAPVLHQTLRYPKLQPHIYGGKGVGSQGDGSALFIARSKEDQQTVAGILRDELGMNPLLSVIAPQG